MICICLFTPNLVYFSNFREIYHLLYEHILNNYSKQKYHAPFQVVLDQYYECI